jgi:tellurium resistance protein TerD
VCGPERKVLGDEHFLFWSNLETPDRSVFLRFQQGAFDPSLDRAQVAIALADLPVGAERIVISLSTIVEAADLGGLRGVSMRVFDPANGTELAGFAMDDSTLTKEACLIVSEVYQHNGNWKVKAIAQGYQSGLAGLGTDFGVNIL